MKKTILKLTAIIIIVGFIHSCNNKTKETHLQKTIEKDEKTNEHHNSDNNSLVLDNGKLWIANKETTSGINNMIKLMNSFADEDNINAYHKLTKNLKSEFTIIFEKCNMTGEAHNQLHNFLFPIKNIFDELSSNDIDKCKEAYDKLNQQLAVYKIYFE